MGVPLSGVRDRMYGNFGFHGRMFMNDEKRSSSVRAKKSAALPAKRKAVVSPEQAVKLYFRGKPKLAASGPIKPSDTATGRGLVKFKLDAGARVATKAG